MSRKCIGIACHIGFKNNRALAVDDTQCGLLDRDIQGSIENHGGLLLATPSSLAQGTPNDRISHHVIRL
jgi:hypothetical protein